MDSIGRTVIFDLICSNMLSFMVVALFFAGLEAVIWYFDLDGARQRRRSQKLRLEARGGEDQTLWIYETFLSLPRAPSDAPAPQSASSARALLFKP